MRVVVRSSDRDRRELAYLRSFPDTVSGPVEEGTYVAIAKKGRRLPDWEWRRPKEFY